ncbi:MAG TPA: RNA polymerase sigma factor [Haliangiales bacterium]|nr:RNA polymerase sigma factor [Haliangiales bacterium]
MRGSWQRFLDVYEPLRPELYRYCRYLTRSPWDAEDLVQDALARAFVTLGCLAQDVPNPRAWLFRVASNLWIDRMRKTREVPGDVPEAVEAREPRATREAAGTLIARLSPQERAAVVLKDAFDLSLEEIAETLSTSTGTVKSALHRGRGKLAAPEAPDVEAQVPAPAVLDAFCAAFNARDVDRLASLLLDTSTAEIVGINVEYGPEAARRGSFWGALQPLAWNDELDCGIADHLLVGYKPSPPRAELRRHRGESIVLFWHAQDDGEVVRDVGRAEIVGDRIARWRNYFFSPEVVAEICGELAVPFRTNGHRYWRATT